MSPLLLSSEFSLLVVVLVLSALQAGRSSILGVLGSSRIGLKARSSSNPLFPAGVPIVNLLLRVFLRVGGPSSSDNDKQKISKSYLVLCYRSKPKSERPKLGKRPKLGDLLVPISDRKLCPKSKHFHSVFGQKPNENV